MRGGLDIFETGVAIGKATARGAGTGWEHVLPVVNDEGMFAIGKAACGIVGTCFEPVTVDDEVVGQEAILRISCKDGIGTGSGGGTSRPCAERDADNALWRLWYPNPSASSWRRSTSGWSMPSSSGVGTRWNEQPPSSMQ